MRLGCEGESATQPQFFVDTQRTYQCLSGWRLSLVGFGPAATRTIHEITLTCTTKSMSGSRILWIASAERAEIS